jgi:hypothetical protein
MAIYDYTGSAAGAPNPAPQNAGGQFVVLKKRMKAADIIASDTTLTAAAKIAANDVIQAIDLPAGFIVMGSAIYSITAEGGTATLDVGVGGGDEAQDGANINATAGTISMTLVGDDWGANSLQGYDLEAADTIDATFKNDTDAADFLLFVYGFQLDLSYDA